jgi:hypothetical protein
MMDEAALGAFLDQAQGDLFRMETLDRYDAGSDGGDFERFLRGEPAPDPARKAAWHKRLAADRERGLRNRRVHVVRSPLSDYLRFEVAWGHAPNAHLEEIRILDLAGTPAPAGLIREDFWLMDDRDVVLMHYDQRCRFTGASVLPPSELPRYRAARDAAWAAAEPFGSWWDAHPQYHSSGRSAA